VIFHPPCIARAATRDSAIRALSAKPQKAPEFALFSPDRRQGQRATWKHHHRESNVSKKWKVGLRNAAILTALVLPGGCIALLAVALVKRVR
jgi:hypothetical protein